MNPPLRTEKDRQEIIQALKTAQLILLPLIMPHTAKKKRQNR